MPHTEDRCEEMDRTAWALIDIPSEGDFYSEFPPDVTDGFIKHYVSRPSSLMVLFDAEDTRQRELVRHLQESAKSASAIHSSSDHFTVPDKLCHLIGCFVFVFPDRVTQQAALSVILPSSAYPLALGDGLWFGADSADPDGIELIYSPDRRVLLLIGTEDFGILMTRLKKLNKRSITARALITESTDRPNHSGEAVTLMRCPLGATP
jgi:hypothetical protein